MILYILIFSLALIGFLGHDLRHDAPSRPWKWILWGLTAAIIVMDALRLNTGLDTWILRCSILWLPAWEVVKESPDYIAALRLELLFSLFRPLGHAAACVICQGLLSAALNIPLTVFVMRYTRRWYLFFMIYFIGFFTALNFEIVRQGAAIGMFLWAWKDFEQRRNGRYLLKILAATFFHMSAIPFFLLPFARMEKVRDTLINYKFLLPAMAICFIVSFNIQNLAPLAFWAKNAVAEDSYAWWILSRCYLYLGDYDIPVLNWKGWTGFTLIYLLYPLFVFYIFKKSNFQHYFQVAAALFCIIGALGIYYEPASRFNLFLLPVVVVAVTRTLPDKANTFLRFSHPKIPVFLREITKSLAGRRVIWFGILAPWAIFHIHLFTLDFAIPFGGHNYDKYYPYTNWIDGKLDPRQDEMIDYYFKSYDDKKARNRKVLYDFEE